MMAPVPLQLAYVAFENLHGESSTDHGREQHNCTDRSHPSGHRVPVWVVEEEGVLLLACRMTVS